MKLRGLSPGRALLVGSVALLAAGAAAPAQTRPPVPQPFPRPPQSAAPPPQAVTPAARTQAPTGPPSEATLGIPIYPAAQYLASYDAGQGQRYYLFGVTASFAEVVGYYKTMLKQRGELVFEEPPTHMFEVGRFREDVMVFPPGVTVKDYTWGGSAGYPNPTRGAGPARFPTVLQFVPVVAEPARAIR
jgi:hypothetical protein